MRWIPQRGAGKLASVGGLRQIDPPPPAIPAGARVDLSLEHALAALQAADPPFVLGFDVGVGRANPGGFAALAPNPLRLVCAAAIPTKSIPGKRVVGQRVDGLRLYDTLGACTAPTRAFVEDPNIQANREGTGSHAPAVLQGALQSVETVLDIRGIPSTRVYPITWKRPLGLWRLPEKTRKHHAIVAAMARFPELGRLLVRESGLAEAALIALWGLKYGPR